MKRTKKIYKFSHHTLSYWVYDCDSIQEAEADLLEKCPYLHWVRLESIGKELWNF